MQAKLDEMCRRSKMPREQFVGIELHLSDTEICEIRGALERQVRDQDSDDNSAADTVDKLLDRF